MSLNIDSITDIDKLLEVAEQLEDDDKTEEALKAAERAAKLFPQNGRARCMQAGLLQDLNKPQEAFKVLVDACRDIPDNADCLFDLGAFLSEHGNMPQACDCYKRVYDLNPDYPRIKLLLGSSLIRIQQWPDAIKYLEEALKTELNELDRARALNSLGEAHMNNLNPEDPEGNKKELAEALEKFNASLEINEYDYVPKGNIAMSYIRLGNIPEALKIIEEAMKKYPNQARLYVIKGIAQGVSDDPEAIKSFEKAIELNPNDPELWFHKAHYYVRSQNFGIALDIFKEGVKHHPNSADLYFNIASLLRHMGRERESIEYHRKGLQLSGRLIHWGFFLVDENNKPVEGTNVAIESDRMIPREKVAQQFFKQLQEQGRKIDDKGIVDGKYRVGMMEIPEDKVTLAPDAKIL